MRLRVWSKRPNTLHLKRILKASSVTEVKDEMCSLLQTLVLMETQCKINYSRLSANLEQTWSREPAAVLKNIPLQRRFKGSYTEAKSVRA